MRISIAHSGTGFEIQWIRNPTVEEHRSNDHGKIGKVHPDEKSNGLLRFNTRNGIRTASSSSSDNPAHGLLQHCDRGQPAFVRGSSPEELYPPPRNVSTSKWKCIPTKKNRPKHLFVEDTRRSDFLGRGKHTFRTGIRQQVQQDCWREQPKSIPQYVCPRRVSTQTVKFGTRLLRALAKSWPDRVSLFSAWFFASCDFSVYVDHLSPIG